MKNIRHQLSAALAIVVLAVFATTAISEVPNQPADNTLIVNAMYPTAPIGSYIEAVTEINGQQTVVDAAAVNPVTGEATVSFPDSHASNKLQLRGAGGALLSVSDYVGALETE